MGCFPDAAPVGPAPAAGEPPLKSPARHAASFEALLRLQNEILEAVASGRMLGDVAALLCRRVEALVPGVLASVLTVDAEGRLQHLACPSLPAEFETAFNGLAIGPAVGSCGTAAHHAREVEVVDIATDPLWAAYRDAVLPHGIVSCWSTPIIARDGRVVGTFAFYSRQRRGSDDQQRQIVRACVHLCAIAIEHDQIWSRNHRLAYYDVLTGLPNRSHFLEALRTAVADAGTRTGMLLFDIDGLKAINDTLGHDAGDALISELARRLGDARVPGRAFRLGGDEFAVLVADCPSNRRLASAAQRLLRLVGARFVTDGQTVPMHITVGGVLQGEDGDDPDALRQNADFALEKAKHTRRGGFLKFREEFREESGGRAKSVRTVSNALREGRIIPYFQPVFDLRTGIVTGVESLARMMLPDGSLVQAKDFQQALTDPRITYDLTGLMLNEITAELRRWRDQGLPPLLFGLNVSTGDLERGDLEARVVRAFSRYDVPLDHLVLEVTEKAMMDGDDAIVASTIGGLRKRGVHLALDDFGTGYASLTHLKSFPVDVIKIDRSFVSVMLDDPASAVIVDTMIDIGHRLGMAVIAEGVETREQADRLIAVGCPLAQGYLMARPGPADVLRQKVASGAWKVAPPHPRNHQKK
ncbi:EAL domain-containing protein [Pseudoxanthobacter sp. M-2]|uniref:putative bifunctional diguanylate cyclase/phosphodiesterase n=1 Tax=Pseudoxanthobacter sp. M-2 TaxID=3078754 RepID=UPI0038FD1BD1